MRQLGVRLLKTKVNCNPKAGLAQSTLAQAERHQKAPRGKARQGCSRRRTDRQKRRSRLLNDWGGQTSPPVHLVLHRLGKQ